MTPEQQSEIDDQRSMLHQTRRATVPALEDLLYLPIPLLDHGFIRPIDYMGDDAAIVQSARVSYGRGTRRISDDRAQLLTWFNQNYPDRDLPSSSCIGCPYHSDSVWKQLKEKNPKSFQEAVFIDQALRNVPATKGAVKGDAYLHKSRIPLVEVDFSEATANDDLMLEECEGLCGI